MNEYSTQIKEKFADPGEIPLLLGEVYDLLLREIFGSPVSEQTLHIAKTLAKSVWYEWEQSGRVFGEMPTLRLQIEGHRLTIGF